MELFGFPRLEDHLSREIICMRYVKEADRMGGKKGMRKEDGGNEEMKE